MKSQTLKLCSLILLGWLSITDINAQIVNVDPLLAGAVKTSGDKEKEALDKISEEQSQIRNLQTLANAQLKKIEAIQRKSYEYLSNISAGVQNAYDIKRSFELTKQIATLCVELKNAVIDNPQGLITVAVATKHISSVTQEVIATYALIANITLNKKTLLNSAERLEITMRVRSQLSKIYYRLYNLIYQVRSLKFSHLPQLLAPQAYYGIISQKEIARSVIRDYFRR